MLQIVPTVLATDFENFRDQLAKLSTVSDYLQVDVMDGKFVPDISFQDIEKIKSLPITTEWELHLMVKDPLKEMKKWTSFKNIRQAIFHIESADDPKKCIEFAKKLGWKIGLAINPETPITAVLSYFGEIDEVLFLCVNPGKQGSAFIPEVKEKIKEFVKLSKRPLCGVDGSVNKDTIVGLKEAGAEIFGVGSALTRATDVKRAYNELKKLIE